VQAGGGESFVFCIIFISMKIFKILFHCVVDLEIYPLLS
jgi:hypothetical protein